MKVGRITAASAALFVFVAAVFAVASACVGDSSVPTDSGADATTDTKLDAPSSDGGADADACAKLCNGSCVAIDDPAYGCTATSCSPCAALPHVTTAKCAGGACAIGACDPAYDDLDTDAGNGCETPNPLAFNPGNLALWLKGDKGIVTGSDGGITSWANQAGDGGLQLVATGSPKVDTTLWPSLPGASSVKFGGGESFAVDVSAMGSASGFTTFIALARYGDGVNCVLGSNTYPSGSPSCCGQAGQAFQMCYLSNTNVSDEVYCNSLQTPTTANISSGYQSALAAMWFDSSLNYFSLNGTVINDSGQCPHALLNTSAPGRLGGGASGPAFTGLVGEVAIYSVLLSGPDHAAVESYFKRKWKTP